MSAFVFLAVLGAALLHAAWNGAIKLGGDKFQGMVLLSLGHGAIGLILILLYPLPESASWAYLALSVVFHLLYKFMLAVAYQYGDLSRVYPIARGFAPVLVLCASLVLGLDSIGLQQIIGVLILSLGIVLMARDAVYAKENTRLIGFALCAAFGTAGYSIADGLGVRAAGQLGAYVGWLFLLDCVLFIALAAYYRGMGALPKSKQDWALGLFAGGASVLAYWIVLWAMNIAPIAVVAALRETSVLFALFIGWLILREPIEPIKRLAAGVIVIGMLALRL